VATSVLSFGSCQENRNLLNNSRM